MLLRQGIILLLCVAIYFRAFFSDFLIWDDDQHILNNPWLNFHDIKNFWLHPYFMMYVPVTYSFWAVLASLAQPLSPLYFHIANVLAHAFNSWLVWEIIRKSLSEYYSEMPKKAIDQAAFIGAIIFCCHPLQVESVLWISCLRDLLATSFALIAIFIYLNENNRNWAMLAIQTMLFTLSLLSKPSAIMLPFGLFALRSANLRLRFEQIRFASMLMVAFVIGLITKYSQINGIFYQTAWYLRPLLAIDAIGFYLAKIFYPWPLAADYGITPQSILSSGSYALNFGLILLIILLVRVLEGRRQDLVRRSLLFSLLIAMPVLGFVSFAYQHISNVADHYMYLPCLGFSLILADIFAHLKRKESRAFVLLLLFIFAILTIVRSGVYRDSKTFFEDMLAKNPNSSSALINLGVLATNSKNHELALQYYAKARILSPENPNAQSDYASTLVSLGRFEECVREFGHFNPDLTKLRDRDISPQAGSLFQSLAVAQMMLGQWEDSRRSFCRSYYANPGNQRLALVADELDRRLVQATGAHLKPCSEGEY